MIERYQRSFADGAATERARLAAAGEMTERDAWTVCDKVFYHLNDGDNGAAIDFIRALITEVAARATAVERERCARLADPPTAPYKGATSSHWRNRRVRLAAAIRKWEGEL